MYDLKTGKERADQSQKISIPAHHGQPDELCALMLRKKDGSTAYRMLVVSEDHSLVLVQQSGRLTIFMLTMPFFESYTQQYSVIPFVNVISAIET